ncbi:hypothetical protein JKP88DRAFT_312313 [Tribonema minus]|uniref:Uncharacterized protein n=1 Tax=Tribonema minus TaxID=303371 RepID=A0A835Z189_9STRA|nr:hypothetical protein JKP88DRAFT_312313 [Tribonema minus]
MSDILRTNVEQAEAIQKIGGTEAALTLLEVLAKSRIYKDVTEFALYWAARARLHEDDGNWRIARSILDEGDAYMSLTPQKMVLGKIIAAFEKRCHEALNQLVDDATTTAGGGGGAAAAAPATKAAAGAWAGPSAEKNTQHGSRASEEEQCNSSQQSFGASPMTAGYRLDPNDASFDSNDLGSTGGGINKALTFAAATSTAASHSEGHAETLEATAAMQASTAREGGISGGTIGQANKLKKKRAPTPHPSGRRPRRRTSTAGDTIDIGADGAEEGGSCGMDCGSSDAPSDVDASGGGESTAALATAKGSKRVATPIVRRVGGKDGGDNESNRAPAASKRVGTPIVRRSERISSVNKHAHAPTPSPLKREMEMMLG